MILAIFIVLALLISNWWWAFAVYVDAGRRNIPSKLKWTFTSLLLGVYGTRLYLTATQRPETAVTLSPYGLLAGDKLEKFGTKGKIFALIFTLVVLAYYVFTIAGNRSNFSSFLINDRGSDFVLVGFIYLLFVVYQIFNIRRPNQPNPLDKPLWGMEVTPQGDVDTSLTKHKTTVKILVAFIVGLLLFWIILILSGIIRMAVNGQFK